MSSFELLIIAEAVITSVKPGVLSDETIQRLRSLFPDTLVLAALDLVDRESGELISPLWLGNNFSHLCLLVLYDLGHFVLYSRYRDLTTFFGDSNQVHDSVGKITLRGPRLHRNIHCIPSDITKPHSSDVSLLHLSCIYIRCLNLGVTYDV